MQIIINIFKVRCSIAQNTISYHEVEIEDLVDLDVWNEVAVLSLVSHVDHKLALKRDLGPMLQNFLRALFTNDHY